ATGAPPVRSRPTPAARNGSNAWAVSGALTDDGRALVASDLHLAFMLPNPFLPLALDYGRDDGDRVRVSGVTLPGFPTFVIGATDRIAWGVSNSAADMTDLVVLAADDADDADTYRTADGRPHRIATATETIQVKGGPAQTMTVHETVFGPLLARGLDGARVAQSWTAHKPGAVTLDLLGLETAAHTDAALARVAGAGLPAQNFVVGDRAGAIGWTIAGTLPDRRGAYSRLPRLSTDPSARWRGLLASEAVPVRRGADRLWTANNRVVGGADLARLGDGFYILGARAGRIATRLGARDRFDEAAMLAIQTDPAAPLMQLWRDRLVAAIEARPALAGSTRATLARLRAWDGQARTDSRSYPAIKAFRDTLRAELFAPVTEAVRRRYPDFEADELGDHGEVPLGQWFAALDVPAATPWADRRERIDRAIAAALDAARSGQRWGQQNRLAMGHPMAPFFPFLKPFTDMESVALPGDRHTILAQTPDHGPVVRMVAAPGRDATALLSLSGGVTSNPRSPFYGRGQAAWIAGAPEPMAAGPAQHRLTLRPTTRARSRDDP
ncbi:penicillin acylase family protein, partial [Rhodothalassium salexigens]